MEKIYKILTFGDSLTQGNPPPNNHHPGKYQFFMRKALEKAGIKADIWNYGIGGQVAGEISIRILDAVNYGDPTDILTIMAGTNDCWRYTQFDEEMSADMRDDVIEQLEYSIEQARKGKNPDIKIILCSIPATRVGAFAHKEMFESIKILRDRIRDLANNNDNVYFCDVFEAFLCEDGYANPNYVVADGVHFTNEGNRVCGETIANCIINILK